MGGNSTSLNVEFNKKNSFNLAKFLIITCLSFIALNIIIALILYDKIVLEGIAVVIIILIGALNAFYIPVKYTFDEHSHYIRNYNLAEGNFIYNFDEEENYPCGLSHLLLYSNWIYNNYEDYVNYVAYENQYSVNDTEVTINNTPQVVYTPLPYICGGIGIKVAQILNLSMLRSVQLAKFANVLFFALIAFLSVRLVPKKKLLFLFYFTMPINIFFAASLGTDYFINALLGLSIALIYKVKCEQRRMSLKMYFLIICILCLIACGKSTYAPVLLLLGLFNKDELPVKISNRVNYISAIVMMFVMFVATYLYGSRYGIALWNLEGVDSATQIRYLLHHPLNGIKVFVNFTFESYKTNIIYKYQKFAYLSDEVKYLGIIEIVGLFVMSLISSEYKKIRITNAGRMFTFLSILGCYGLSVIALYVTFTKIGSNTVCGFQGRYCLPMAFIVYAYIGLHDGIILNDKFRRIPYVLCFVLVFITILMYVQLFKNYVI